MNDLNKKFKNSLFEYAFCPRMDEQLKDLSEKAMPEDWNFKSMPHKNLPILSNYIKHTFQRIKEEYEELEGEEKNKKIAISGDYSCFNTGLYTENYEPIYGLFKKNNNPNKNPWYLIGFFKQSSHDLIKFANLPQRANYFRDISDLIFDYRYDIRIDVDHILKENCGRLPESLRNAQALSGAVEIAKKKVAANYKLAIPQYYDGRIQLLIPISCTDTDEDTIALVIWKEQYFYIGRTVLTIEMAYNNARLIAKPESDWLKP